MKIHGDENLRDFNDSPGISSDSKASSLNSTLILKLIPLSSTCYPVNHRQFGDKGAASAQFLRAQMT